VCEKLISKTKLANSQSILYFLKSIFTFLESILYFLKRQNTLLEIINTFQESIHASLKSKHDFSGTKTVYYNQYQLVTNK